MYKFFDGDYNAETADRLEKILNDKLKERFKDCNEAVIEDFTPKNNELKIGVCEDSESDEWDYSFWELTTEEMEIASCVIDEGNSAYFKWERE